MTPFQLFAMSRKSGLFVSAVALMTACAGIQVSRLTSDNDQVKGVRFYRPAPYLLVTADAKGELKASLVYLPKINEEYVIQSKSGLGSAEAKFKLEGGWNLTEFGQTSDSKTAELVTSLAGLLKGATTELTATGAPSPAPGLYAFIFDPKTGLVTEIKPVHLFK